MNVIQMALILHRDSFRLNQLSSILDHFEGLSEIDRDGVPPTAQSFDLTNVERADEPGEPIEREGALDGAPRRQDGYFRVRAVLD